jgi:hypothetical protein
MRQPCHHFCTKCDPVGDVTLSHCQQLVRVNKFYLLFSGSPLPKPGETSSPKTACHGLFCHDFLFLANKMLNLVPKLVNLVNKNGRRTVCMACTSGEQRQGANFAEFNSLTWCRIHSQFDRHKELAYPRESI